VKRKPQTFQKTHKNPGHSESVSSDSLSEAEGWDSTNPSLWRFWERTTGKGSSAVAQKFRKKNGYEPS
jgi:hypothetical protein